MQQKTPELMLHKSKVIISLL